MVRNPQEMSKQGQVLGWKKTFVRCGEWLRCKKMDRSRWWVEDRPEGVVQESKVLDLGLGNPKRGLVFMWDEGFRR